jgi:thioredoxin-dependent peroxiredoxin
VRLRGVCRDREFSETFGQFELPDPKVRRDLAAAKDAPGARRECRPWQTVPMAQITLRGNPINTVGELPGVGSPAPGFILTGTDLGEVSSEQFRNKPVLLNIFPSLDTPVCGTSVRTFNERAAGSGLSVLCVSKDLPFAQKRFCGAEGIENVTTASAFRDGFGTDYGVTITDGPMAGLLARAVVVIGADGNVAYTELVPEIATEPDYDAALAALKSLA